MFKSINNKIDRFLDKSLGGHISIGKVTIYGRNAMRWGVNIRTKKYGYICFNLPIPINGRLDKFYFYLSPNATPWASTYYRGRNNVERKNSKIRKECFGHGFDTSVHNEELRYINNNGKIPENIIRDKKLSSILDGN